MHICKRFVVCRVQHHKVVRLIQTQGVARDWEACNPKSKSSFTPLQYLPSQDLSQNPPLPPLQSLPSQGQTNRAISGLCDSHSACSTYIGMGSLIRVAWIYSLAFSFSSSYLLLTVLPPTPPTSDVLLLHPCPPLIRIRGKRLGDSLSPPSHNSWPHPPPSASSACWPVATPTPAIPPLILPNLNLRRKIRWPFALDTDPAHQISLASLLPCSSLKPPPPPLARFLHSSVDTCLSMLQLMVSCASNKYWNRHSSKNLDKHSKTQTCGSFSSSFHFEPISPIRFESRGRPSHEYNPWVLQLAMSSLIASRWMPCRRLVTDNTKWFPTPWDQVASTLTINCGIHWCEANVSKLEACSTILK